MAGRGLQLAGSALSSLGVQPTYLFPAGMEITSYNHHREGSFLPNVCDPQTKTTGFNRAFALIQSTLRALCKGLGYWRSSANFLGTSALAIGAGFFFPL